MLFSKDFSCEEQTTVTILTCPLGKLNQRKEKPNNFYQLFISVLIRFLVSDLQYIK